MESESARFRRGRVVALMAPGPSRTDPVCEVFGACGGCTWQHVEYGAQVAAKREIVRDALVRIGRLAFSGEIELVPSPSPYAYRGRARVVVRGGRVGFRRLRSRALAATARCPVLTPPLQRALADLARRPPPDDGEWELASGADDEVRATPLGPAPDQAEDGSRPARRDLRRGHAGAPLQQRVGGDLLAITPGVFAQANALLWDPLAAAVHEAAGRGDFALELHAGAGFLTLGLARRFARLVAVESDAAAVRDLARNLGTADLGHVTVLREGAERVLGAWRDDEPDVVVLDPPRAGLEPDGATALARVGARRIVYLSCDPATLARDARVLAAEGYGLVRVRAFDLFPQTAHVETLAEMERGRA